MVVAKAEATAGCPGPPNPAISCTPESTTRAPPSEEPLGGGLASDAPQVSAPMQEGPPHRVSLRLSQREGRGAGRGAAGPHLEVRAVVVVPVHDLPLPAAPGQHGDHLPPRQVCVELRGKDVDP